jgi:geranylgeranyl diphosphate synthase type II
MLHTYSLIHDDLPCMDNSDFRRGRPSLHKAYNEGHAVLVGDFLLTFAFELIALSPSLSAEQRNALILVLASSAGGNGMIGGQVMDLANTSQAIDLPTLERLHQKKTGALLTAALEFGGIVAGANQPILHQLRTLGHKIGHAYQIVDDILDATGTQELLGKPAGIDIANSKQNYVSLLGLQQAQKHAAHLHASAQAIVRALPGDPSPLCALVDMMVHRQA